MTAYLVIRIIIILLALFAICSCIHVGFDVPWPKALIPLWLVLAGLGICGCFAGFMHLMTAIFNAD